MVFYPESGPDLEGWVRHRFLAVLNGKDSLMAGGMRRSATLKGLDEKTREPVDTCAIYLLNKSHYLHYDYYLSQGFPIATGVIEGACRHLIKDRFEITRAKWRLPSAEAVLRLRALRSIKDKALTMGKRPELRGGGLVCSMGDGLQSRHCAKQKPSCKAMKEFFATRILWRAY